MKIKQIIGLTGESLGTIHMKARLIVLDDNGQLHELRDNKGGGEYWKKIELPEGPEEKKVKEVLSVLRCANSELDFEEAEDLSYESAVSARHFISQAMNKLEGGD